MRTWQRAFAGFVHRVVYGTLLGAFVWYLTVVPYTMTPIPHVIHHSLLMVLDFPVALVNERLPWQLKAIDAFSSDRQPEYGNEWEYLYGHLRTAVPVYVVLFYLPNLVMWIVRRFRNGRTARPYTFGVKNDGTIGISFEPPPLAWTYYLSSKSRVGFNATEPIYRWMWRPFAVVLVGTSTSRRAFVGTEVASAHAIVERPELYRWSICRATVGLEAPPAWLALDRPPRFPSDCIG